MSDFENVIDARSQNKYPVDLLPYILWERPINYGLGKTQGEEIVKEKMVLFDQRGGPFSWVDAPTIAYYMQKPGWKVVDFGNFDVFKQSNGQPFGVLEEVLGIIQGHRESYRQIQAKDAEILQLHRDLEAARAASAPSGLTDAERDELEAFRAAAAEAAAKEQAAAEAAANKKAK